MTVGSLALVALVSLSAAAPTVHIHRDLAYGSDPLQKLDVYEESRHSPQPVMVFVHGGGWSEGDKGTHFRKGTFFVREGFVYVTLNYRLAPAAHHPAPAEDVASALAWVHSHIHLYGGDPQRIFLMGHSAGAQLAALVAIDAKLLGAHKLQNDFLRGVILLDGSGYDLVTRIPSSRGWSREMFVGAFGLDPAVWKDASPARHVEKGHRYPPFLLFHIESRKASRQQAREFAQRLTEAGAKAEVVSVAGRNHVSIVRRLGLGEDPVARRLLRFIRAETKPQL